VADCNRGDTLRVVDASLDAAAEAEVEAQVEKDLAFEKLQACCKLADGLLRRRRRKRRRRKLSKSNSCLGNLLKDGNLADCGGGGALSGVPRCAGGAERELERLRGGSKRQS